MDLVEDLCQAVEAAIHDAYRCWEEEEIEPEVLIIPRSTIVQLEDTLALLREHQPV